MENNAHKEIKVYGTLLNLTINTNPDGTQSDLVDNTHKDYLTVAYQLYDERFSPKKGSGRNGAVIATDKYQDIINKRLTAISYDPNKDITNIYSNLYVDGDTNIGGDLTVEGDTIFKGDVNITGDISIDMGLGDLNDVALSTMAVGQVLRYNGSKWVNAKLSIDDLQMPAATNGQVLKFNGTKWVAGTDNDTKNIDFILPDASEGQVLKYINGHWVPGTDNTGGSGTSLNQPLSSINNAGLSAPSAANNILMWNGSAWVYTTIGDISMTIGGTTKTLNQWLADLVAGAGLWTVSGSTLVPSDNTKSVTAAGFYDSTIS